MALDMAASTLQGGRGLEDVPQRLGAGLAAGGEVVQRGDELVALVGQTVGLVPLRRRLHLRLLPALSLVGVQDLHGRKAESAISRPMGAEQETCARAGVVFYLEYPGDFFSFGSVHVSLRDWSDVKQFAGRDDKNRNENRYFMSKLPHFSIKDKQFSGFEPIQTHS